MSEVATVTQDSDICQVLSCLPEKFVVDFANGIDVGRDHIRVQRQRDSMFNRFCDSFTGQGARRQAEINASLIDGVEASLNWLTDLCESLSRSNLAIARVNDRVNELKFSVAKLADYSADTRQRLEQLATQLDQRCSLIEQEVSRIDFIQRVQLHLDQVFNKWKAGRFRHCSLPGRCYAALEELRWGAFGDYMRTQPVHQRNDFLADLANRALAQMAVDAACTETERKDTYWWIAQPDGKSGSSDFAAALAYMGDWYSSDHSPLVYAVSQSPNEFPLAVPRVCSAERVSETLVEEVFGGVGHV